MKVQGDVDVTDFAQGVGDAGERGKSFLNFIEAQFDAGKMAVLEFVMTDADFAEAKLAEEIFSALDHGKLFWRDGFAVGNPRA